MKTRFSHIATYIVYGIVGMVTVFVLIAALPIPGNYEFRMVLTGSMEPTIPTGAVVVVVPQNGYREGDIVTFRKQEETDMPFTHRIVEARIISGEVMYTTKGDANDHPDERRIPQGEVIGKVLFDIPYAGYAFSFLQTPRGLLTAIGALAILAAWVVVDEVRRSRRRERADHGEQ